MKKVSIEDLVNEPADGLVRVKIMSHIGEFAPDDLVDCSEDEAKTLCRSTQVDIGGGKKDVKVRALRLKDAEEMEKRLTDPAFMSKDELAAMGKKNIVPTPVDHSFEKKLDRLRKMDQDWLDGKKTPPVGEEFKRGKNKGQKEDQVSTQGA